jgi:hypothetical protein
MQALGNAVDEQISDVDIASCRAFFQDMRRRGLPDPLLVVSDTGARDHPGDRGMLAALAPPALLSAQDEEPAKQSARGRLAGFKARATACYQAASPALARLLRDDIAATYSRNLPSAVACLDDDFAACIAHLNFPLGHRQAIRTTDEVDKRIFCGQANFLPA